MERYLKIFFSSALMLVVLAQFAATYYFFSLIEKKNEVSNHRMYEIRSFPESLRCGLVKYWIEKNLDNNGDVLVLGDSQPFGFNVQHMNIFSAVLNRSDSIKGLTIKNASIIDGYFDDAQNVLQIITHKISRLKTVIINVNPAHFKSEYHTPQYLPTYQCEIPSIFSVLSSSELLASMKILAIENLQNPNLSAPWLLRVKDVAPLPPEVMDGPLPPDYITEINNKKYEKDFISFLAMANTIADQTIVYMSPMQLYKKLPLAQANIRKRYMELCEDFARTQGGVTCLDPTTQFNKKDFIDIVHLSSEGHKKLAIIIEPYI